VNGTAAFTNSQGRLGNAESESPTRLHSEPHPANEATILAGRLAVKIKFLRSSAEPLWDAGLRPARSHPVIS